MKYNTTYTPKIDLKDTLINIDRIKRSIKSFYKKKFQLIEVTPPLHDLENSELLLELNSETRHITFDFANEYRVGKIFLSHTNWIHTLLKKINLKPNEGLLAEANYIWRDIKENSSISAERNEITIQILIPENVDAKEVVELEIYNLYYEILNINNNLKNKSKTFFDENIDIFSSQNLFNMMPELSPKERETKLILDRNAFILKNPGKKMLNGKRHSYIAPTIYDLNNHYQLFLKDKINSWPMRIASISLIAVGQELADQLKVYKETKFLELEHYADNIKSNRKIMEIKINIPRLIMVLLEKGHISEVQAGTSNEEVKNIKDRYKVETL